MQALGRGKQGHDHSDGEKLMYTKTATIDSCIRGILLDGPQSPKEIVRRVGQWGFGEASIREAIWRLLDNGTGYTTSDRLIALSPRGGVRKNPEDEIWNEAVEAVAKEMEEKALAERMLGYDLLTCFASEPHYKKADNWDELAAFVRTLKK